MTDGASLSVGPYNDSVVILALVTIRLAAWIVSRMSPSLDRASGFTMARVLPGPGRSRERVSD